MKGDETKTESKRVILNDSNYVAWRRLTLAIIGAKNQTLTPSFTPYVNKYERPKIEEKREIADVEAIRATMKTIHDGMSKNMQIAYSNLETPSTLWEELRCTKDPANRKLDTSAADTYQGFGIKENQSIPDFLRAVREIEVRCTALGETLHLGMAAQKTI
ncbi:UNVERIFIED_CONTAM: hypothetical protein HDU68_001728 [Siphonaria sp. JEL0065]|nr:hypothetical protein HDU68_001728 [Siphonaria sp. JEL0065]